MRMPDIRLLCFFICTPSNIQIVIDYKIVIRMYFPYFVQALGKTL